MVKAVIFDMGNILLDFNTRGLTAAFTDCGEDAALLHREMFEGPDWLILDRGGTEEEGQAQSVQLPGQAVDLRSGGEKLVPVGHSLVRRRPEPLGQTLLHAGQPLLLRASPV